MHRIQQFHHIIQASDSFTNPRSYYIESWTEASHIDLSNQ